MSMSQEARKEAERLLRNGQKIEALKYLADTYGVSLQESKLLVEALELELFGKPQPLPEEPEMQGEESLTNEDADFFEDEDRKDIEHLLRTKSKIEAVKWLKEKRDLGLKEALRRVEIIEREINPNAPQAGKGCATNIFLLVGSIFSLVGLILLGIGGLIYSLDADIVQEPNKAQGVVTDLLRNGNMSAPVITYTWQGKEYKYESNSYTSPSAFDYNEAVTLYVNPEDPNEVVIDTFSERWLAIVILGGIGIVFAGMGIIFVFVSRRF